MLEKYIEDLNLFYDATSIPFCVFDNTLKDLYRCPHMKDMECSAVTMKACCDRLAIVPLDKHLPVFSYSNFCFFAMLRLDKNINILFGPVISMPMTYREFDKYNKSVIIAEDMLHLYNVSQRGPLMSLSRFMNNILMFIKIMFNENIRMEDILTKEIEFCENDNGKEKHKSSDNAEILVKKASNFQKQIIYYMKKGNSSAIKKEFHDTDFFNYLALRPMTAEEMIQIFFSYIIICCVAVMESGVDTGKAVQIFDTYSSKGKIIKNVNELKAVCRNISIDYCNEIENLEKFDTESSVVRKCMHYIHNNIQSKISVNNLAEYCGVSARTISRHFEQYCDMSVAKYIMKLKLKEAAFLLADTDMKLSEISNQLSFSSQSHLNNAFKGEYSCTPQMYRSQKCQGKRK
ncbi:AraC family transcriptional regulator [Eubacterium sp. MSJ-13]|uniref:helix-turn-helix domain-containing protein n=1 Tax=Eubacterium sp. MSJ-13 TaxID=2841513 RepID=UPI001C115915|nr:helix-turn-helix domain-containing protein [Eubacterium sp. MSJ-13]MBU5478137.1 AraC family transcriptional regulator [Eubacterium sp. MSJ-13]